MTYKEIAYKYKELYIMLVEKAGRETGNKYYLNVDELLNKRGNKLDNVIEAIYSEEPNFRMMVGAFIALLIFEIYGMETVKTWDEEKAVGSISEFYKLYLRKPTIRFCEKYGLEPLDDPELGFRVYEKAITKSTDEEDS